MKKHVWLFFAFLLTVLLTSLPASATASLTETEAPAHRVVRVGFFPFEGYYQLTDTGQRYGPAIRLWLRAAAAYGSAHKLVLCLHR